MSEYSLTTLRNASKYNVEDVVSYEEMLKMKRFISRIKQNAQIRALLRNDPMTADVLEECDSDQDVEKSGGGIVDHNLYETLDTNGGSLKRRSNGLPRSPLMNRGAAATGLSSKSSTKGYDAVPFTEGDSRSRNPHLSINT